MVKLYLVPGISEDTQYGPHTRKEISEVGWVPLKQLPGWPGGDDSKQKFVDVRPFVTDLCRWVEEQLGDSRSRTSSSSKQRSPSPLQPELRNAEGVATPLTQQHG